MVNDEDKSYDEGDQKDQKVSNKVQKMMAEVSDIKQALKRDNGKSRSTVDQIYTGKFKEDVEREVGQSNTAKNTISDNRTDIRDFYRGVPMSRHNEDFNSPDYNHEMMFGNETRSDNLMQQFDREESTLEVFREASLNQMELVNQTENTTEVKRTGSAIITINDEGS